MEEHSHSANPTLLTKTKEIQNQTQKTLDRILRQAGETEEVGRLALTSLEAHDKQLDTILDETARTRETLKKTDKLQNKFSRWSLNFGDRRRAKKAVRKQKLHRSRKEKVCRDFRIKKRDDKAVLLNKENKERDILLGTLADKTENEPTIPEIKSNKHCVESALSLKDEKSLQDIAITEESIIEPALDALGEQLDGLMSLSLSMNEAINKEGDKLNMAEKKLNKVRDSLDVANFRIAATTK